MWKRKNSKKTFFKKNKLYSPIILFAFAFTIVTGGVLALFSDFSYGIFNIKAGTLDIDIKTSTTEISNQWTTGDITDFQYTVENQGTAAAKITNKMRIFWDTSSDLKEAEVIYLYDSNHTDEEIY